MTTLRPIAFLTVTGWLAVAIPALAKPVDPPLDQQVEEVASYLEGIMSTADQAATVPNAPDVQMTTCRISLADSQPASNIVFLYQEQALAGKLAKPYRQRFLQLSPSPYSQSIRSLSYRPNDPTVFINFCNKPLKERAVRLQKLGSPVCSVFLKRSSDATYIGNTPVDGCPAHFRGAVRITNQIVLSKTGMNTWDRGYDGNGKQVWGAKAEAYQYKKQ